MTEIDHSLRRLGTDYVDLYQIHRFDARDAAGRNAGSPSRLVKAGKVRYLGASSHVRLAVRQGPVHLRSPRT